MPYTSALETTAAAASAKIRPYILRTSHDRYPWLFISPSSREDVRAVVECLFKVFTSRSISKRDADTANRTHRNYKLYPVKLEYNLVTTRGILWRISTPSFGLLGQECWIRRSPIITWLSLAWTTSTIITDFLKLTKPPYHLESFLSCRMISQ